MKSMPSGSSVSLCQTIAGLRPVTCSSATARSRSQLEPGKTMTALFMRLSSRSIRKFSMTVLARSLRHMSSISLSLGALGEVELDQLAGADIVDPREAEAFERMVDRLALRIEDPVLQRDEDARFHGFSRSFPDVPPLWPASACGASFTLYLPC